MKNKNKGFTLVELLVSIAILAIVGGTIAGFLSISSHTYVGVSQEVNVQYESQLAVNQIKDLIIDANRGVSYALQSVDGAFHTVDPDDENSETQILADLLAANPANDGKVKRSLLIYNENLKDDGSYEFPVIKIEWNPDLQQVYYASKTYTAVTDLETDKYLQSVPQGEYKLLAEYTEAFSVGLKNIKKGEVDLKMSFQNQEKKYETTPSIALRNRIIVSDDLRQIYEDNPPKVPSLALRVIIKKNGIPITTDSLLTGDAVDYDAQVEMQFGAASDNAVTWSLEGSNVAAGKTPSVVNQNGLVTVSPDEKATTLTLKATSAKLTGKPGIVTISVDNIDKNYGYVRTVALGELFTTNMTGSGQTGGHSISYRFDFEDREPYIVYLNEAKLTAAQHGVKWTMTTTAPAGTYVWDASKGEVTAFFGANNHNFTITATAKVTKPDKVTYASDTKVIAVSGIPEKPSDPGVEIVPETTNLSRNDTTTITAQTTQLSNPTYKWEISGYSGEFAPENINDGKYYPDEIKRECVKLTNKESEKVTITVDSWLAWKEDFWIEVKVTVSGTIINDKGQQETKTIIKTQQLNIKAVSVTLEIKDANGNGMDPDNLVMGYYNPGVTITPNFENLKNFNGDMTNPDIRKINRWGVEEEADTDWNRDNHIIQSGNKMEYLGWDEKNRKFSLDKGGKVVFTKDIKNRDRYEGMNVSFTFSNLNTGEVNKIEEKLHFTFEYEK